jgi:RHS repeat-associated protein
VINNALTVLEHRHYEPYGALYAGTMAETPFGFTGEWRDGGTGMVYLRARYYNPAIGTFASKDMLETPNRYAYVGGNVVNRVDPSGMIFWAFPTFDATLLYQPSAYRSNRPAHAWIEYWLEQQNGFFRSHAEFPGQGTKIDMLIFDPQVPYLFSDAIPSVTAYFGGERGAVYEIGPAIRPVRVADEFIEVVRKHRMISLGTFPFAHTGIIAPNGDRWVPPRPSNGFSGNHYDWRDVTWILGDRLSANIDIGPVRIDPTFLGDAGSLPDAYWIALPVDGLVLYLSERDMTLRGLALTASSAAQEIWRVYNRAARGRGLPQPRPIPVAVSQPSLSWLNDSEEGLLCTFLNAGACYSLESSPSLVFPAFPFDFELLAEY